MDAISKFVAGEQERGLAAGTINRSVSALRRMFNLAKKQGKLRDVPYFPMVKEAPPRQGFFEREDYEKLFTALPSYLRLPLALGYFTGMREGEILGLRWNQVDFLSGIIRLRAGETKNDEGREVPIASQLLESLKKQYAARQRECEPRLLPSRARRTRHANSGISQSVVLCLCEGGTRKRGTGP